jgi:hypothetical protein
VARAAGGDRAAAGPGGLLVGRVHATCRAPSSARIARDTRGTSSRGMKRPVWAPSAVESVRCTRGASIRAGRVGAASGAEPAPLLVVRVHATCGASFSSRFTRNTRGTSMRCRERPLRAALGGRNGPMYSWGEYRAGTAPGPAGTGGPPVAGATAATAARERVSRGPVRPACARPPRARPGSAKRARACRGCSRRTSAPSAP